jgi:hypothetical protein
MKNSEDFQKMQISTIFHLLFSLEEAVACGLWNEKN